MLFRPHFQEEMCFCFHWRGVLAASSGPLTQDISCLILVLRKQASMRSEETQKESGTLDACEGITRINQYHKSILLLLQASRIHQVSEMFVSVHVFTLQWAIYVAGGCVDVEKALGLFNHYATLGERGTEMSRGAAFPGAFFFLPGASQYSASPFQCANHWHFPLARIILALSYWKCFLQLCCFLAPAFPLLLILLWCYLLRSELNVVSEDGYHLSWAFLSGQGD